MAQSKENPSRIVTQIVNAKYESPEVRMVWGLRKTIPESSRTIGNKNPLPGEMLSCHGRV